MKRSIFIAVLIAIAASLWIASGEFGAGSGPEPQKEPANLAALDRQQMVRVSRITAEPHIRRLVIRGATEANRTVDLRAEAAGRVIELPAEKGSLVRAGQVIARLSTEDREARLQEAKALREQRRIEYEASRKLADKGFRAQTQLAAAKAALEAADAAVKKAEVELENLEVAAPFSGRLESRLAELGDYLKVGDPVARLVDLDPLRVVGYVSEQDVDQLSLGRQGELRFLGKADGVATLSYIASEAEPGTRTFRIELTLANPERKIPAGMTTEVALARNPVMAHRISPAILTLADNGKVGVRSVSEEGVVAFREVQIVAETPEAVWITGLPQEVMVIVVGQEFVKDGEKVKAIDAESLQPVAPETAG